MLDWWVTNFRGSIFGAHVVLTYLLDPVGCSMLLTKDYLSIKINQIFDQDWLIINHYKYLPIGSDVVWSMSFFFGCGGCGYRTLLFIHHPLKGQAESCFHNLKYLKSEDCEVVFSAVVGSSLGILWLFSSWCAFPFNNQQPWPPWWPPHAPSASRCPSRWWWDRSMACGKSGEEWDSQKDMFSYWLIIIPNIIIYIHIYIHIYIYTYTYIYMYIYIHTYWLGSISPNYSSTKVLNTAQLNYPHYQQKILYKFKWGILME